MNISEIALLPTTRNGINESEFRSYHLLEMVVDLLERKVPVDVVLEIVYMIESVHDKPTPQAWTNQSQTVLADEFTAQHIRKNNVA
jgi:hypothetical protein